MKECIIGTYKNLTVVSGFLFYVQRFIIYLFLSLLSTVSGSHPLFQMPDQCL